MIPSALLKDLRVLVLYSVELKVMVELALDLVPNSVMYSGVRLHALS